MTISKEQIKNVSDEVARAVVDNLNRGMDVPSEDDLSEAIQLLLDREFTKLRT